MHHLSRIGLLSFIFIFGCAVYLHHFFGSFSSFCPAISTAGWLAGWLA
jgi:hypothetical protein